MAIRVVAFNGSARKDGNTAILLRHVLSELEKEGLETELVQLSGVTIHGCLACRECFGLCTGGWIVAEHGKASATLND